MLALGTLDDGVWDPPPYMIFLVTSFKSILFSKLKVKEVIDGIKTKQSPATD